MASVNPLDPYSARGYRGLESLIAEVEKLVSLRFDFNAANARSTMALNFYSLGKNRKILPFNIQYNA